MLQIQRDNKHKLYLCPIFVTEPFRIACFCNKLIQPNILTVFMDKFKSLDILFPTKVNLENEGILYSACSNLINLVTVLFYTYCRKNITENYFPKNAIVDALKALLLLKY